MYALLTSADWILIKWVGILVAVLVLIVLGALVVISVLNVRYEIRQQRETPELIALAPTVEWVGVGSQRRKYRVLSQFARDREKRQKAEAEQREAQKRKSDNPEIPEDMVPDEPPELPDEHVLEVYGHSQAGLWFDFVSFGIATGGMVVALYWMAFQFKAHPFGYTWHPIIMEGSRRTHAHVVTHYVPFSHWGAVSCAVVADLLILWAFLHVLRSYVDWSGDYTVLGDRNLHRIWVYSPFAFWKDHDGKFVPLDKITFAGSDTFWLLKWTKSGALLVNVAGDADNKDFNRKRWMPTPGRIAASIKRASDAAKQAGRVDVNKMASAIREAVRLGMLDAFNEMRKS